MSTSIFDAIMYGNLVAHDICLPTYIFRLMITILFPPIGVWIKQHDAGYPEPGKIAICLILTSLFYFPGLIYALNNYQCSETDGMNRSYLRSNDTNVAEDKQRFSYSGESGF